MIAFIYGVQVGALLFCVYMVWQARYALNGLARGLVLLCLLLVIRRIDDIFGILDQTATTVLSSAVVAVVFLDIYKLYSERKVYALYLQNRKARIEQYDRMSEADQPRQT